MYIEQKTEFFREEIVNREPEASISYQDTAQTQEKEWQWLRSLIHGIKNVDVLLAQRGERHPLCQHKSLIFNNREYSF